jgi:hypothetical protein
MQTHGPPRGSRPRGLGARDFLGAEIVEGRAFATTILELRC